MNKCLLIPLFLLCIFYHTGLSPADEANSLEIRGTVATGDFEWNPQNFAGFYYDIDDNLGTEKIVTTITEGNKLQETTVVYTIAAQINDFDYAPWGYYRVIGFLGKQYFAGYLLDPDMPAEDQILYLESTDENSLSDEQLEEILMDSDDEITVTSGTPLKLKDGYELAIKSIDINSGKVYLELKKDGQVVDSKIISPMQYYPTMADETYYYKKDVGNSKDLVIIAVHFKNAFSGSGQNLATVDGIWQISDVATDVKADTEYDKMRIATVTSDTITMDNKDNTITLNKNSEISLMGDIKIKTADQNADDDANPLRYYIFKTETDPGIYEIRGQVATGDFLWNPQNFAGFYYDIDNNIGTETLKTTITEGNKLQEPTGIIYITIAQKNSFAFNKWGYYNVIGFLGKRYFTGYIDDSLAGTTSEILVEANVTNLLGFGKLAEVLIDEGDEKILDLGKSIDLKEGYALKPTVGTDNKGLLVELLKDEKVIDRKAVLLPGTYVYATKVGDAEGIPLIAAHFQEPIFLDSKSYCKVDGLWQISENTTNVEVDTKYDKMRIASVDSTSGIITMDNTDDTVILSKNLETSLLGDVKIKTADQDIIDEANPLRYYIFKSAEITADEGSL